MVEIERHEGACGYLKQLESIDAFRVLFSQVKQVFDVQKVSLLTLNRETDLLIDLLLVKEEHEIVIAEVSLLVVI